MAKNPKEEETQKIKISSKVFRRYISEDQFEDIDINKGVAGYIVKNPNAILFSDLKNQEQFD